MDRHIMLPRYPLIAERVLTYVKDYEIIKNRGDREINIITEINSCNDIAIEKNDKVVVYASKDRYNLINDIKNFYSKWIKDIDEKIVIYRKKLTEWRKSYGL